MITITQAIILGLLQGFSELFPISSLGHSVVLPRLLGWDIQRDNPYFLSFLVATHLATAIVLVGFFWRDWVGILCGMGRSLRDRAIKETDAQAKLGWLLVTGTIPAGIIGLLFQKPLESLFASAQIAAFFLMLNGLLLYGAEVLRRKAKENLPDTGSDARIATMKWAQAVIVGTAQTIALIPGFSRSGATMGGSLLVGLSHEDSARFSFLLATPIIGAAAVLKLPELLAPGSGNAMLLPAIIGAVCSGVTAYLSVKFLMKYFRTNTLTPFAIYCGVAGGLLSLYFLV